MNIGAPDQVWPSFGQARARVLGIQTKLHQWARSDAHRRFDDLFNLVADPASSRPIGLATPGPSD